MIEALSYEWLLAIGITLIGIEALLFSFFLLPVGVGFISVAILELIGVKLDTLFSQIAIALVIALFIIYIFKKIKKDTLVKEERVHQGGVGVVDGSQIRFEGTFWNTDSDLSSFKDGDRVKVSIIDNKAVIEKLTPEEK